MNIYQSIVQAPLVLDICQLSTYQVIEASESFYFNQFDIVNQMRIFIRCWDYVKHSKTLETDIEVLKALPLTIKDFNPTYEKLKNTYFKAGLHANSTEEEIEKVKKISTTCWQMKINSKSRRSTRSSRTTTRSSING